MKTAAILIATMRNGVQPGGKSSALAVSPSSTKRCQRTMKIVPNTAKARPRITSPSTIPNQPAAPSSIATISAATRIAKGSHASSTARPAFCQTVE